MEKKTYSLWNHIRYFMGYFHKYEGYMIYPVAILYIVCSVLNSFLGMAFASAAVKWLTIEKAGKALTIILGYVLLLQVVEMGESLGMEKIYGKFFLYRVSFSRNRRQPVGISGAEMRMEWNRCFGIFPYC